LKVVEVVWFVIERFKSFIKKYCYCGYKVEKCAWCGRKLNYSDLLEDKLICVGGGKHFCSYECLECWLEDVFNKKKVINKND